jgi:hypothetical protein
MKWMDRLPDLGGFNSGITESLTIMSVRKAIDCFNLIISLRTRQRLSSKTAKRATPLPAEYFSRNIVGEVSG